jgi:hypothetical protein
MEVIENFFNWLAGIDFGWLIVLVFFLYFMLFLEETVDVIKKIINKNRSYHNIY